jgi:hypothetical protein
VSTKLIAKKVKTVASRATPSKAVPLRKICVMKMVLLRVKLRPQGTLEIELALAKLVGVSKFFCLLDAPSSSLGPHGGGLAVTKAGEHTAPMAGFDNLADDSSSRCLRGPLSLRKQRRAPATSAIDA